MFSSGLIRPYPVNRPLTDEERARQVKQQDHIDIGPADQLSVIKVNSTYLEVVDKYYADKGWFTLGALMIILALLGFLIYIVIEEMIENRAWPVTIFVSLTLIPVFALCIWGLRKESFQYTHYPARFNRKTRMVHVFLVDGRQLSVAWDAVFFEIAPGFMPGDNDSWEVRGHIMDEAGHSIQATFAVMNPDVGEDGREVVIRQWEFIRRYMEEDYVAIINQVENCMPIDGRRETWFQAWQRLLVLARMPGRYFFIGLVLKCYMTIQTPFRMFAMYTSKLPVWSDEIEAVNVVEPEDPYVKNSSINMKGLQ